MPEDFKVVFKITLMSCNERADYCKLGLRSDFKK